MNRIAPGPAYLDCVTFAAQFGADIIKLRSKSVGDIRRHDIVSEKLTASVLDRFVIHESEMISGRVILTDPLAAEARVCE